MLLNSDADLLDALTSLYGAPLVTINEIPPVTGNFDLKGADCLVITPEGNGVRITNPCGKPCCSQEEYLTPVYSSLNQLNARHVRLEDLLRGTVTNTDILLGRMKDLENSVGIGGF